jgi:glycine betaine/proline transport system substrate-binding protein
MEESMKTRLVAIILAALFIIAGFGSPAMADKKKVRIGYVEWACATASSNTVKAVLEE